jgi:hypothetical protein
MGSEWGNAEKEGRSPSWAGLTARAIVQACDQQASNSKTVDWHPHLSAHNISAYLDEVAPKYLWWRYPPPVAAQPDEDGE